MQRPERWLTLKRSEFLKPASLDAGLQLQAMALDQIEDAVIAIDAEYRLTYANRAAELRYGFAAAQATGRPLTDLFQYRWIKPADEAQAMEALEKNGSWRGENIHVRRDGTELHVESAVSAMKDESGKTTSLLAVIRDVTQRKKDEAAIHASEGRL